MRFHNLVPVNAAESGRGSNGAAAASCSSAATGFQDSSLGNGYCLPPPEIRDIVDALPLPMLSFSPLRDKILFLKRRSLPHLAELARPELKLAGVRIDGKSDSQSRMNPQDHDDGSLGPEKEIYGFPCGAKLNFVTWSNDGSCLAFSVRTDEEDGSSSMLNLWVADVVTGKSRPLFDDQISS